MTAEPASNQPEPSAASAWRRTAPMLAAWVTAAVLAGAPAGPESSASAQTSSAPAPKIVHSGPECMAGRAAPPAKNRGGKD